MKWDSELSTTTSSSSSILSYKGALMFYSPEQCTLQVIANSEDLVK